MAGATVELIFFYARIISSVFSADNIKLPSLVPGVTTLLKPVWEEGYLAEVTCDLIESEMRTLLVGSLRILRL